MTWSKFPTFTAGEALLPKRRVKVESGTTTDPVEVIYADAGEQHIGTTRNDAIADGAAVSVQPMNATGTFEGTAAGAFSRGATLYGAADGKIDDASSGSAIGIALEAATADDDVVQWISFAVLSTTAATVSFADAAGATAAATSEAALAELYANILSAANFIGIPLNTFRETTNFDVGAIAVNGGILASDTTPILEAINAATDGCQRLVWAATNVDQVVTSIPLPPNLDVASDLVLHTRIRSDTNASDAVGFTVDTFFNEGDTKVVDTSETNATDGWLEKITTIAAADIPAGAQTITIGLTPVAHGTDAMELSSAWLEYTATVLT